MALIRSCRLAVRNGRPQFVPGGLACAATARRILIVPTAFRLSLTPKRASGALSSPVIRLAPSPA